MLLVCATEAFVGLTEALLDFAELVGSLVEPSPGLGCQVRNYLLKVGLTPEFPQSNPNDPIFRRASSRARIDCLGPKFHPPRENICNPATLTIREANSLYLWHPARGD